MASGTCSGRPAERILPTVTLRTLLLAALLALLAAVCVVVGVVSVLALNPFLTLGPTTTGLRPGADG